ncbi:MAG: hypothetical protein ACRDE8_01690 [Ginsengibacter sp.]
MKSNLILLVILLLITFNCSSQVAIQKQLNQKKASGKPITALINPALIRDTLVRTPLKTNTQNTVAPNKIKATTEEEKKILSPVKQNIKKSTGNKK